MAGTSAVQVERKFHELVPTMDTMELSVILWSFAKSGHAPASVFTAAVPYVLAKCAPLFAIIDLAAILPLVPLAPSWLPSVAMPTEQTATCNGSPCSLLIDDDDDDDIAAIVSLFT